MQRQNGLYFTSWEGRCNLMQVDIISAYQLKIVFILHVVHLTVRSIFWWASPKTAVLLCKMKGEVLFVYLGPLPFILLLSTLLLFIWDNRAGLLPLMMLRVSCLWMFLRHRILSIDVLIHDYLNIYSC
jgi:hypothetical protein